jgi:hypothetical protein
MGFPDRRLAGAECHSFPLLATCFNAGEPFIPDIAERTAMP